METIKRTVTIPKDRKLRMDITIPAHVPTGDADILLVISPCPQKPDEQLTDLNEFVGILTLHEDPVEYQRRIRDEWS